MVNRATIWVLRKETCIVTYHCIATASANFKILIKTDQSIPGTGTYRARRAYYIARAQYWKANFVQMQEKDRLNQTTASN